MVQIDVESENGWRPASLGPNSSSLVWITVPGTDVTLRLMVGQPATCLGAWAADWNAYIEPLQDPICAGYTDGNKVYTSNHKNGTAIDLNWDFHPLQQRGSLNVAQMKTLSEMEDFYEDVVFWAGRWDDPIDEMHSQMGYGSWNNPKTDDFIKRKIRPDGFSTFRRGPIPQLSRQERYALTIIEEGRKLGITPRGQQIALCVGLVESELTNYANSNDKPSLLIPHDAVGSDYDSLGWAQQRPAWGTRECRMNIACAARLFFAVDNGPGVRGLTKIRERINGHDGNLYDYNDTSRSPGFYAQKVQGSAFPDRYDMRFVDAVLLYNKVTQYTPPIGEDDFLSALTPDEQRNLYNAVMTQRKSRSPLRRLGEGTVGDAPDQTWDIDGNVHVLLVYLLAKLGHPSQLALLRSVANADPDKYPDRQEDRQLAQAILADVQATTHSVPVSKPNTQLTVIEPEVIHEATVVDSQPVNMAAANNVLGALSFLGQFHAEYNKLFSQLTDQGEGNDSGHHSIQS